MKRVLTSALVGLVAGTCLGFTYEDGLPIPYPDYVEKDPVASALVAGITNKVATAATNYVFVPQASPTNYVVFQSNVNGTAYFDICVTNSGVATFGTATGSYGIVQWDGSGYYVSPFLVAPTGGALNVAFFTNQVQFGALSSTSSVNQSFIVPAGRTQLVLECIGGGGGGGPAASGGAGGYARNTVDVVPGENLTVRVGQGGRYNSSVGSLPGGGIGALGLNGAGTYSCGNGGGYSAVLRGTNILCLAAGGGGGSGGGSSVSGAAGGGSSGAAGTANAGYGTNRVAGGGTQTSGGTNGVGGTVGTFLLGGNGGTNANYSFCGGGGGAGWFGGGGGGAISSGTGGGAGGSCYAPAPYGAMIRGPNTGADNYQSPWGNGGSSTTAGSDGRVIVSYP